MSETQGEAFSAYEVMSSWLTPSCLFIIINLVIATIAITSRFANPTKKQLQRSPSLLDRLMSFRCYKHETSNPVQTHDAPRFDRVSSSLLDRVRSFNLALHEEDPKPDPNEPTKQQLTRAPSLLERLMSVKLYRSESVKEPEPEPKAKVTEEEEEEGVDAKADDFINRFRQQLRLQRLDSILRYRDMLKRN
ncbi:pathogen-associated molecular patterns-induced protein A70-like [Abrus precatorius]|uniref:Pathogen-associated molecular patterns-induced protein A70-like n=1 Tax=Abrus precatorius TaxID=3816 RepID=A0A8B8K623_ABRPR|nr:pathogen-associated molecular patterns-induced protein A70-like [Abrus precatorius]